MLDAPPNGTLTVLCDLCLTGFSVWMTGRGDLVVMPDRDLARAASSHMKGWLLLRVRIEPSLLHLCPECRTVFEPAGRRPAQPCSIEGR